MNCRLLIFLLGAGLLGGACRKAASPAAVPDSPPAAGGGAANAQGPGQPKLPVVQVLLGAEKMAAEIAVTPEQFGAGLMFRTNLEENAGMLCVLPRVSQPTCWTKNCPLALSMAFIDPNGCIVELHDFEPQSTNLISAAATNVQYVLETGRGWFDRHHIARGTLARTERGSFPETFSPAGANGK